MQIGAPLARIHRDVRNVAQTQVAQILSRSQLNVGPSGPKKRLVLGSLQALFSANMFGPPSGLAPHCTSCFRNEFEPAAKSTLVDQSTDPVQHEAAEL